MKIRPAILPVCLAACCLSVIPCFADRVILNDGREFECRIQEEASDKITVEMKGVKVTFVRSQIKEIVREKAPAAETDTALTQGDSLFAAGDYDQALQAYRKALETKPEEARARIAAVEKAIVEEHLRNLDSELSALSLTDQIERLRSQLKEPDLRPEIASPVQERLIRALLKAAKDAEDHLNGPKAERLFQEAWDASPKDREIAWSYALFLQKQDPKDPRIGRVLRPYLIANPEDVAAADLFAETTMRSDPWFVLKVLYPNGQLRPDATSKTQGLLPDLLRTCFDSNQPPPADAPFGPASCYERLMALEPTTPRLPLLLYRIREDPKSAQAHHDLGRYYYEEGDLPKAIEALEESVRIQEAAAARQTLTAARESFEKSQIEKAQQELGKKRPEEAQKICEAVLRIIPASASAYELLQKTQSLQQCRSCGGSGRVLCKACQGTGRLTEREPLQAEVPFYDVLESDRVWVQDNSQTPPKKLDLTIPRTVKCKKCGAVWPQGGGSLVSIDEDLPTLDTYLSRMQAFRSRFRQCPRCKFETLTTTQMKTTSSVCPQCNGAGGFGACPVCNGAGMTALKHPRPTTVDVSRFQKKDAPADGE
jgi:tetratricopeptide (TPR) repeat protein